MGTGSTARPRGRRVLLVEDNTDELSMYMTRLQEMGWDSREVTSGADVLQAALDFRPHVIVTDLNLPEIDGAEAIRALKGDDRTKAVPVVVLSGFPKRSMDAYQAGCHTFLTKPCLPETLLEIIDAIAAEARG